MMQQRSYILILDILHQEKILGVDATNFFNYLSGYTTKPHFHHLSVAPFDIREQFMDLIDEEIRYHRQYGNGYIIAKMNSLTDKPLIKKNVRSITSWSKGRAHCSRNMLLYDLVFQM